MSQRATSRTDSPAVTDPSVAGSVPQPAATTTGPDGASTPATDRDAGAVRAPASSLSSDTLVEAGAAVELAPFHVVGRFDGRDPAGPRLGWPGTQIRARFSGPAISVVLKDTGTSDYDVSIDGGAPVLLAVSGDAHPYELAAGLAPGEHDLVLTKRTETVTGITQVLGFSGTLVPTPAPAGRRIEMIGDSMTCGFGVLGTSPACPFSPDTEDETAAWGALAANELGALRSVTAVSGMGLLRNFGGETIETMPTRYDRALADDASSAWDPHAFEPDVVVVALGTNDFNGGKGDPGPAFQATFASFLATLRARHAQAHIVAATSPMMVGDDRTTLRTYVQAAVAARQTAGDANVSSLDLAQQLASDGYGCDFHPSVTTQKKMAAALVAHVKARLGW